MRGIVARTEVWQAGMAMQGDGSGQTNVDNFAAAVTSFFGGLLGAWTPDVYPTSVLVQSIDEGTGKVTGSWDKAVTKPSFVGSAMCPAECAICVSIKPVSGTVGGRFYLPSPSVGQLDSLGNLTSSAADAIATGLQSMFETLGGNTSPLRLGIYRGKTHTFIGSTEINVGTVIDSQRRRRNKLVEVRSKRAVL